MENSMQVPQNTKNRVKLPYDPAIPPLGIHLEKIIIQKDTVPPAPCSQKHYLQQSKHGSNLNVHQQMSG